MSKDNKKRLRWISIAFEELLKATRDAEEQFTEFLSTDGGGSVDVDGALGRLRIARLSAEKSLAKSIEIFGECP